MLDNWTAEGRPSVRIQLFFFPQGQGLWSAPRWGGSQWQLAETPLQLEGKREHSILFQCDEDFLNGRPWLKVVLWYQGTANLGPCFAGKKILPVSGVGQAAGEARGDSVAPISSTLREKAARLLAQV